MTQDDFDRLVVGGADGELAQNLADDTEDGPRSPVAQSYLPATRSHGDGGWEQPARIEDAHEHSSDDTNSELEEGAEQEEEEEEEQQQQEQQREEEAAAEEEEERGWRMKRGGGGGEQEGSERESGIGPGRRLAPAPTQSRAATACRRSRCRRRA